MRVSGALVAASAQNSLSKRAALLSLPIYRCMGMGSFEEAPLEMTHRVLQRLSSTYSHVSQTLAPPLSDEEASLLVTTPLKESTVDELEGLSRDLEASGVNYGDHRTEASLDRKSIILNNFCATLERLEQVDRLEATKVKCLELSQMHKALFPDKAPYASTYTKEGFGNLFSRAQRGKLCVNDEFRPVLKAVFGK